MTLPSTVDRPASRPRNPERTRARILSAALHEFSAEGLAGARVDRIARRARVNKRMLYHYFGNKDDLFRAILGLKVAQAGARIDAMPADPEESLPYWFEIACRDLDWLRLLEWEALRVGAGPVIGESERQATYARALHELRRRQADGRLDAKLDPRQLLLSMMALTAFPLAFPQITRLVTGQAPTDPAFRAARTEFLRRFARAFRNGD